MIFSYDQQDEIRRESLDDIDKVDKINFQERNKKKN